MTTGMDVRCAMFHLRRTSRTISQLYDEVLRPTGLRGTQYSLLCFVNGRGPITVTELGQFMGMDRTTATRNLRVLEREGQVAIRPGRDRRTRVVEITSKGRSALEAAHPYWEEAQAAVVGALGDERWTGLERELDAVNDISAAALQARD